jgi:hypothetical protein
MWSTSFINKPLILMAYNAQNKTRALQFRYASDWGVFLRGFF